MARPEPGTVLVLGALHWDVIVRAPALPRLDETLIGRDVRYAFGGKGGNQAVAAAQMGARVAMAGRVGTDAAGQAMRAVLDQAGVDHQQVSTDPGASGMSVAIVDAKGDYGAVVVSAANLTLAPGTVTIPQDTRVVVLQNEVPEPVNVELARQAREQGVPVIWNAAPARAEPDGMRALCDLLVLNRVEAADLTGHQSTVDQIAALNDVPRVVLTLGAEGAVLADGGQVTARAAMPVKVVSSHGAGDMFVGALASQLASGLPFEQSVDFAMTAAALHVSAPVEARSALTADDVRARLKDR